MITAAHRAQMLAAIEQAQRQGAHLRAGGAIPAQHSRGFYLEPAVFTDVHPQSDLAKNEIFGPVIGIFTADDEAAALALANGTQFGLAGSVWSRDHSRALSFAKRMQAGNVGINTPFIRDIRCPFGGFKQSGIGAVGGRWSLEQYTQTQTLCVPLNGYSLPKYGVRQ
ncbi:NAD/NADP-dependent betaine aldehyde dehydrogenase [compost metagenome]